MTELLLSPKPLSEFTPQEFRDYIEKLYVKPETKSAAGVSVRTNAKGTLILTTKRKPKWILRTEIEALAVEVKKPIAEVWNYCVRKGFKICATEEAVLEPVATARKTKTVETRRATE